MCHAEAFLSSGGRQTAAALEAARYGFLPVQLSTAFISYRSAPALSGQGCGRAPGDEGGGELHLGGGLGVRYNKIVPGDSGAPVYSGDTAVGIAVAFNNNYDLWYYTPIQTAIGYDEWLPSDLLLMLQRHFDCSSSPVALDLLAIGDGVRSARGRSCARCPGGAGAAAQRSSGGLRGR